MLALCLTAGAFAAFVGLGYEWSLLRTVYPAFLMTKGDDFDAIHRLEERGIGEIVPIALLNIAAPAPPKEIGARSTFPNHRPLWASASHLSCWPLPATASSPTR